jgi:hypothetical protein
VHKKRKLLAQTRTGKINYLLNNTLDVDVINTDSPRLRQKLVMSKSDYAMWKERAIKYRQTSWRE